MLISESGDAQTVRFRAFREISPIDVRSNVRMTDLLERRRKLPMLFADLERPGRPIRRIKFIAGKSVVEREHMTALQFRREIVDPIKRRQIDFSFVTGGTRGQLFYECLQRWIDNRLIGKNKFVVFKSDKFFAPTITGRDQQV